MARKKKLWDEIHPESRYAVMRYGILGKSKNGLYIGSLQRELITSQKHVYNKQLINEFSYCSFIARLDRLIADRD